MTDESITKLLDDVRKGVPASRDRLFEAVFAELRTMARAKALGERVQNRPESGSLVNEAFGRLHGQAFVNRKHLFAAFAVEMERVLVDRARKRNAARHGSGKAPAPLAGVEVAGEGDRSAGGSLDVVIVSDLFADLRKARPRAAEALQLHFFGGLPTSMVAQVLDVDERTVRRDLNAAKDWLRQAAGVSGDSG